MTAGARTAPAVRLSYRVDEAARLTGATEPEIRRACRDGELPAVKRGRYWLIPADALRTWVGA